jgi:hypothetical protein
MSKDVDICKHIDKVSRNMYVSGMVREGRRSEHTDFTRAVQIQLYGALKESKLHSVNGLSKAVPQISRSQLYLLLTGDAVLDVADMELICGALGIDPSEIIRLAEDTVWPDRTRSTLKERREKSWAEEKRRRRFAQTYPQPMDEAAREQE